MITGLSVYLPTLSNEPYKTFTFGATLVFTLHSMQWFVNKKR